jgi:hypothetical protein
MDCMSSVLALAEPVPLTLASFIAKSLVDGIIFMFWHGHNKDEAGLAPLARKWAKMGMFGYFIVIPAKAGIQTTQLSCKSHCYFDIMYRTALSGINERYNIPRGTIKK